MNSIEQSIRIPEKLFMGRRPDAVEYILKHIGWHNFSHGLTECKFDFIDFFSGCGGMSYGFYLLGKRYGLFRHVGAIDIDEHANKTFLRNFGDEPSNVDLARTPLEMITREINKKRKPRRNPLIVIGCAPCQGFSSHRKKDPRKDGRNSLIEKFAEIALSLKPKFIIMENVPDLLTYKHWHHYVAFKEMLEGKGYNISSAILNMAHFGVPQERFRAVILASKEFIPSMPRPLFKNRGDFVTVRDAIGDLPELQSGGRSAEDPMHITSRHRQDTVAVFSKIPKDGGSRPQGVGPACLDRVSGFYDVYGRLYWDRPAVTITARCRTPSCGRFLHPEQNRGLSVREAATLQGFPLDFIFEGPFDDKYKQIGNAVPPIFSTVLAAHVLSMLAGLNHSNKEDWQRIDAPIAKSYSSVIAMIKQGYSTQE